MSVPSTWSPRGLPGYLLESWKLSCPCKQKLQMKLGRFLSCRPGPGTDFAGLLSIDLSRQPPCPRFPEQAGVPVPDD